MGIYGVDLICHVEREMPSTLTYLVLRPFEAESAGKTGPRATVAHHARALEPTVKLSRAVSFFAFTDAIDFSQVTSLKKKVCQE